MRKEEKREETPTVAPGMSDLEELETNATEEEVKRGDYTKVVTMSFDEVDPS
jgi:flagellar biosynthesis/type III secretory pathway M-ring protein FliF/YscJ